MKIFKGIILASAVFATTGAMAEAVDYDKLHDQFSQITSAAINKMPLPFKWYEGAMVKRVDMQGTNVIWYVTVTDPTYFPGGANAPSVEEMEMGVKALLYKGYCNKPFSNILPVNVIFRMENGANPVSFHPSFVANTAKDC